MWEAYGWKIATQAALVIFQAMRISGALRGRVIGAATTREVKKSGSISKTRVCRAVFIARSSSNTQSKRQDRTRRAVPGKSMALIEMVCPGPTVERFSPAAMEF